MMSRFSEMWDKIFMTKYDGKITIQSESLYCCYFCMTSFYDCTFLYNPNKVLSKHSPDHHVSQKEKPHFLSFTKLICFPKKKKDSSSLFCCAQVERNLRISSTITLRWRTKKNPRNLLVFVIALKKDNIREKRNTRDRTKEKLQNTIFKYSPSR